LTAYLELADYLLIAEAVLGVPAELIADFNRIGLADSALAAPRAGFGGIDAYPDFETTAAVLCWHLVKNHPLPDGNKRCAFLATSSSWSATAGPGCRHPVIRRRPTT
jgi:death-on-curing protein